MSQEDYWKLSGAPNISHVSDFAKKSLKIIKDSKKKSIFELGCGLGSDSIYFTKHGLNVSALDLTEVCLNKFIEAAVKINFYQSKIEDFDFKSVNFDVLYAHLSLHYFTAARTKEIFNKIYQSLPLGGLVFIKCKSTKDKFYGAGELIEPDMFNHDGHIRHFFSKEFMQECLKDFRALDIQETSFCYTNYQADFIEAVAEKI